MDSRYENYTMTLASDVGPSERVEVPNPMP
jgi:hypothetical protein